MASPGRARTKQTELQETQTERPQEPPPPSPSWASSLRCGAAGPPSGAGSRACVHNHGHQLFPSGDLGCAGVPVRRLPALLAAAGSRHPEPSASRPGLAGPGACRLTGRTSRVSCHWPWKGSPAAIGALAGDGVHCLHPNLPTRRIWAGAWGLAHVMAKAAPTTGR